MNLFMIYIGGRTPQSMIELHDMRFIIAEKVEDTYADLKKSWWGTPESLHLDCWGKLTYADGHKIILSKTPSQNENKLFFINLGGYAKHEFTELHKNVFIVAPDEATAKKRAVSLVNDWQEGHKDYLYDVENVFCLNQIAKDKSMYIDLQKTDHAMEFQFDYGYVPIGKK